MTTEDKDEDYIKATKRGPTSVETDIHWSFDDPHEAGHIIAKLIKTLIQGFERKAHIPREIILQEIFEGLHCQIDDSFLHGDDSKSVILELDPVDLSKLN